MKNLFSLLFLFFSVSIVVAQNKNGFILGQVGKEQLDMKVYPSDTSAAAVFLDEFGEAYIDNNGDNNLILEYKAKYKILKKAGLEEANFKIPLYKDGSTRQSIRTINATVYNLQNGLAVTSVLNPKDIFTTQSSEHWDEVAFTLPNVMVGSVFEVSFVLESPFIFNFWPWKFQSHLPKVKSEYWARIPGNYIYNIAFKGFVKLNVNESSIVKDCFTPGGRYVAECALYKYMIKDVPAFIEEEYMLAKSNYLSSIDYELSEIRFFDGRVIKYTKTWKDVDNELSTDENFGKQIKKAKSLHEKKLTSLLASASVPRQKAEVVYEYIKNHYQWNSRYSKYTTQDVKNAFDSRKGNVGDINLSLVGALQAAGLNADPVILATRDFGLPHQLFPVISEFNYVVAQVDLGSEKVMLDATESLLPFGMLPERCLNGKGRLISKQVEESNWVDIKPAQKRVKKAILNLKLVDNVFKGTLNIISSGYEGYEKRAKILSEESEQKYMEKFQNEFANITMSDYKVESLRDLSQPLSETMQIEIPIDEINPQKLYLNPFFVDRIESNPFKSTQRLYPVDFGAPLETTFLLNIELPEQFKVEENIENSAFTLPANGGRYLLNASTIENKVSVTSIININKVLFASNEYHNLKELFSRIVESHNSQIVFAKQ